MRSRRLAAVAVVGGLALATAPLAFAPLASVGAVTTTLVPAGSTWRYLDNGSNQGTAWRASGFADGGWAQGAAQLGYGDGDEATVVSYGPNAAAKYRTTYFRRQFTVNTAWASISTGMPGHTARAFETAALTLPASWIWLSLISSASKSPLR